ncbi:MAG: penicillin-binding protein 2 [Xanthomonadales bacterium]|nr:penicillin-binding protein 2 [Xanthomonadales bacterium]
MKPRPLRANPRLRLYAVLLVFGVAGSGLLARAIDLQVLRKDFYQEQGDARFLREVPIPAYRGSITDRNGEPLAVSTPVISLWADPGRLLEAADRVGELADALGVDEAGLRDKLEQRREREFVYLERHMSPQKAQRVLDLELPGVNSQREFKRYYPAGEVFGHVLGFTNIDDRGQEGLELAFDHWLAGTPGSKRVIRDRRGRVVETVEQAQPPKPGQDLSLSLDRRLQYLAYRELTAAIVENKATAGSVVVLDVHTGEVLAMVNQPSFNPNNRSRASTSRMRNRATIDVFEPGSVIKPFTVAAALESGRFDPHTVIDTTPGTLAVANHVVRDVSNYGRLDLAGILAKSSNVGATRLAQGMPPEHLWDMYHRFGFGQPTGSGFPGEAPGSLPDPKRWGPVERATLSYGYGLSTTVLQLAQGFAALADGGRMRAPTFVRGSDNPSTAVIDPMLAEQVKTMLETVTAPGGTATRANVDHYRVAGKSGTARKIGVGGYEARYTSVFAGYAPAEQPRIACVVFIDEPKAGQYYGGAVAAPVFSRVVGGALRLFDIPPGNGLPPGTHMASLASFAEPVEP